MMQASNRFHGWASHRQPARRSLDGQLEREERDDRVIDPVEDLLVSVDDQAGDQHHGVRNDDADNHPVQPRRVVIRGRVHAAAVAVGMAARSSSINRVAWPAVTPALTRTLIACANSGSISA